MLIGRAVRLLLRSVFLGSGYNVISMAIPLWHGVLRNVLDIV